MDRVESRVEGNGPPPGKNWAKASTLEAAKREAIAYLAQGQESQHQVPAVPIDEAVDDQSEDSEDGLGASTLVASAIVSTQPLAPVLLPQRTYARSSKPHEPPTGTSPLAVVQPTSSTHQAAMNVL